MAQAAVPHPDDTGPPEPTEGTGLCLSGGGYRAMLFHLGALWRLYETGVLHKVDHVASVSGGSIAAAALALAWDKLGNGGDPAPFATHIITPLRRLASTTLDIRAVLGGIALPGTISTHLAAAYDRHLFHGAMLADLPDAPQFILHATNLESGVLWRFTKGFMGDYRVGTITRPRLRLAEAVAASSAFPPYLSPFVLKVSPDQFDQVPAGLDDSFRRNIYLTDGGVYDNLGLESAFKCCKTLLVSDGGGGFADDAKPGADWMRGTLRVISVVDNQVRDLRKRQLINALADGQRLGAYWGIRTDIEGYGIGDALGCPQARTLALAHTPTRLGTTPPRLQEGLINWGYAVCDTALRRYVDTTITPPTSFPYPERGI